MGQVMSPSLSFYYEVRGDEFWEVGFQWPGGV